MIQRLTFCRWSVVWSIMAAAVLIVPLAVAQEAPPLVVTAEPDTSAQATSRLVTLDGEAMVVTALTIDQQGTVTGRGQRDGQNNEISLSLMALRRIDLHATPIDPTNPVEPTAASITSPVTPPATTLLYQDGGGVLRLTGATISQRSITITWPIAGHEPLSLPLVGVRGFLLQMPAPDAQPDASFADALAAEAAMTTDRVFVTAEVDKPLQSVACLLESLDDQQATVVYNDKSRTIARNKIYGIILANPGGSGKPITGQCLVITTDGSRLLAGIDSLDSTSLGARIGDTALVIPQDRITRIDVRSDRMLFLSDLQPVEVIESSFPAFDWPWRRDGNVMGKPMQLGGKTYDKGLGVHARCLLTFAVPEGFDAFAATVGLQPPVRGKGDCEMAVLADGRELWRKRVRGEDEPLPINIDIRGAKRITLAVEPGADLDLADHANWADARFIRSK